MGTHLARRADTSGGWLKPAERAISLVIATRNRADQLDQCLRAISMLDFSPDDWELVVVDNGSTDDTKDVVRAAQSYMPTTMTYVFEAARGASAARNAGAVASAGEIIVFTDDDCYVAPDFLSQVIAAFSQNAKLGWVTGRVELHDPNDAPVTINLSRTPKRFASRKFLYTDDVIGANLAFSRKALNEVGGYDELLGAGGVLAAAEDLDLTSRASSLGWEGAYDPSIVVSHHHGRSVMEIAPLYKNYNIGRGAYTIKYLYRGQIVEFLRGMVSVRFRLGPFTTWMTREKRSMVFWETYGGFAYTGLRIMKMLRRRPSSKNGKAPVVRFEPASLTQTDTPARSPVDTAEGASPVSTCGHNVGD